MNFKYLIGAAVLACTIGGSYYYYTTTPTYSVLQVREAIKEHDVDLFEKHVDVDTFINRLVDDLFAYQMKGLADQEDGEAAKLASQFSAGLIQLVKPAFVSNIKSSTIRFVETGEMDAAKSQSTNQPQAALNSPSNASVHGLAASLGIKDGQVFDYDIERDGKTAIVSLPFKNDLDLDVTLKFLMRDKGGHWQIVQLNNVAEIMSDIEKEKERLVAEKVSEAAIGISGTAKPKATGGGPYGIHFALLNNANEAADLLSKLNAYGEPAFISKSSDRSLFRVMTGPYPDKEAADSARDRVRDHGNLVGFVVTLSAEDTGTNTSN